MEIKADKTALSSAQINGGVYQDPKHVQYFNSLKTFSEEREPIQMRLRALMAEKDVPEDQKEAFSKLISATNDSVWAVVAKERTFKEEWVKANPDDMFSAFVLKYSGSRKQKELFDSLSPAVQSSAVGKEISKQIKVSETFDQGRKNLKVGLAFTDFTLTDANGGKISLSDLKGKYTLVDFWGSWCGPCRQANKQMVEIYKKYGQRTDFEIIGMALDKVDAQWRDAIKKDSLVWHQVNMCEEKDPLKAVNIIHGIYMYPTKVLLDQHGIIIAIQLGDNIENDIVIRKLEEVFAL